jgi:hypothetical protein
MRTHATPSKLATITNKTRPTGSFSSSWPGGQPCRPGVLFYIFSLQVAAPRASTWRASTAWCSSRGGGPPHPHTTGQHRPRSTAWPGPPSDPLPRHRTCRSCRTTAGKMPTVPPVLPDPSGVFIPDPGSRAYKAPDPGWLCKNPKNYYLTLGRIRDHVYFGSRV